MIESSFIILEGVGSKLERDIWKQGIKTWGSFIESKRIKGISNPRKLYYDRRLKQARKELYNFNSSYFIGLLPQSEMWRLYDFFKEDAVFLDIETTGLYENDELTIIGLYDGISTKTMLSGNFNYNILKKELCKHKLIVTFNGSSFDIPFINKRYPGLIPKIPHFDVKSITRKIGLQGGLKEVEKKVGINRSQIIGKFNGGDAATLWRIYKATGDDYYLKLLIEYNEDDIINLKRIAGYATEKLRDVILKDLVDCNLLPNALPRHSLFKNNP